ncbi:hypothetical protein OC835_003321 [Tilletia horrida]|uniref:TAFII55 protein conserved region domain-containing protein n=1 Tax=Tilletia horrida TaxID=155126 RepID=A0AAN6GKJ8_9BASI|nr:hypothetical protein OC835_003321 [Tilletia horrida]KAK0538934.1 hypothetical protein OC842_001131 [Tilletia horrida]
MDGSGSTDTAPAHPPDAPDAGATAPRPQSAASASTVQLPSTPMPATAAVISTTPALQPGLLAQSAPDQTQAVLPSTTTVEQLPLPPLPPQAQPPLAESQPQTSISNGLPAPTPSSTAEPSSQPAEGGPSTAASGSATGRRPSRRSTRPPNGPQLVDGSTGMTTRQAHAASKAPRFKVKMSKGEQGSAPKNAAYMQGYNRELDSSDDEGEGLAFEEQLIFRMPAGKDCDKLREMVRNREVGESGATEVSLEFKDSRRAVFKFGNSRFSAKLVDLPTITESHKILENKQMFKVADISQMLLVEDKLRDDDPRADANGGSGPGNQRHSGVGHGEADRGFDIDDFIYPHGITPPMHWARKRRFRRRANKRNIETVEKEVERLLEEDEFAEKVEFEVIDESALDHISDSEMGDNAPSIAAATPRPMSEDGDSQIGDLPEGAESKRADAAGEGEEDEEPEEDEVDEDLAAALDAALEEAEEEETDSEDGEAEGDGERDGVAAEDEDDAEEEEEEDDEDEEQAEQRIRVNQLEAECREIDTLVKRKQADVDRATNPMIKQRLDRSLKALQAELESKRAQLLALRQEREHRKEEAAQAEAEAEEERNRQEEEKEALAQAQAAANAEAEEAERAASPQKAVTESQAQPSAASSPSGADRTGRPTGAQGAASKGTPGRASTLKEVLIGDASSRAGSASQPQSQRQNGATSVADSPAATIAVAMEVDEPELSQRRGATEEEEEDDGEEEEDDDDEADEDEDAGAAPNEDSDAEEDEGLWS